MLDKKYGTFGWVCLILVIVGGVNWGLVGISGFNLVTFLVGQWPAIERIVYILVGLAAVAVIFFAYKCYSNKCESNVPPNSRM